MIRAVIGVLYILAGLNCNSTVSAFELITNEEAGRSSGCPDRLRSVFPGPLIEFLPKAPEESPFDLTIRLTAFAGARIDQHSLQLDYHKKPRAINLLPRIRHLIEAQDSEVVIPIYKAEVPPGQHEIVVRVKDTRRLASEKYFDFCIANSDVAKSNCAAQKANCKQPLYR